MKIMKNKYKVLILAFVIDFFVLYIASKAGLAARLPYADAISAFILFLPIVMLLIHMSKDVNFSVKKRKFFKLIDLDTVS